MPRLFAVLAFVFTVFSPLVAQPLHFGEPFPVSGTRYRTSGGHPRLVSNSSDVVMFWLADGRVRATRYVPGEARVGRAVMNVPSNYNDAAFDVAWMGTHYLVVTSLAEGSKRQVVGQFVDRNGVPYGERVTIAEGHLARLASNGTRTLLVYADTAGFKSVLLDAQGRAASVPQALVSGSWPISIIPTQYGFRVLSAAGDRGAQLMSIDNEGRVQIDRDYAGRIPLVALATNGSQLLAVWMQENTLIAHLLDANGTIAAERILHDATPREGVEFVHEIAAAWNGSEWAVAFRTTAAKLHVVHLDAAVTRETLRENAPAWGNGTLSLLAMNNRVLAAWSPRGTSAGTQMTAAEPPIFITALPLSNVGEAVSYAPAQQTLLATASSADATLVVWRESGDSRDALWTGVRRTDGTWSEREIAPYTRDTVAAGSDGREFVVVADRNADTAVFRLDSNGAPIGEPVITPPLRPIDIAWNGRTYAVSSYGATVHSLAPNGTLTATRQITSEFGLDSAIASDGAGFYSAWAIGGHVLCTCPPYAVGIAGIPLSGDLTPAAATPRRIAEGGPSAPAVVWDGATYVVVWGDEDGVFASRIMNGPDLPTMITTDISDASDTIDVSAVAVSGGTAILWRTYGDTTHRMRFMHRDGSLSNTIVLSRIAPNVPDVPAELETIGPNKLAYVYTEVRDREPHHGTRRIMMRVGTSSVPPLVAEAPELRGATRGRRSFVVEWDASEQDVDGYRLEVRIAGGLWNEVEGFFAPDNRRYVHDTLYGTDVQFRVRAINEGGAGAYSNVISIPAVKRRPVR